MSRLLDLVTSVPRTVIALIALGTVLAATQLPRLRLETDGRAFVPPAHPAIRFTEEMEAHFGARDVILVGIVNDRSPEGIFTPSTLHRLRRLTEGLQALEGVRSGKVVSLATEDHLTGGAGWINFEPFLAPGPVTGDGAAGLAAAVRADPLSVGWLVAADRTAAGILVPLEPGVDRQAVYARIRALVAAEGETPETIHVAGSPVVESMLGLHIIRDLRVMLPLVGAVVGLMLFLSFRSWRGVFLPLLEVGVCLTWTFGLMAALDKPIYLVTAVLPVILMGIGVADEIHIFERYHARARAGGDRDRRSLVIASVLEVWRPVVYTTLTTGIGFLSFLLTDMPPLQEFGCFTAFGVFSAMVCSFTLVPAVLALLPVPGGGEPAGAGEGAGGPWSLTALLARGGRGVYRVRAGVLLGTVVLAAGAAWGCARLYVQDSWIGNFTPTSDVHRADRMFNEKFAGTHLLNVVVDGREPDALHGPDLLRWIDRLQRRLEAMPQVGGTLSVVDFLKKIHRVLHEDDPAAARVPETAGQVADCLLLHNISGGPDSLEPVLDPDHRRANLRVALRQADYVKTAQVMAAVRAFVQDHPPPARARVRFAGDAFVSQTAVGLIVTDQLTTLLVVLAGVVLFTALMFRSVVAGVITVVPVGLAVLLNFGIMGWAGIPLGIPTSMFASLAVGIGIDYTIHFLARYRTAIRAGHHPEAATFQTMTTTGRAIFWNAAVVAAGFLVLGLSQTPPNRLLGGLVALSMGTCLLATLTLLPALLARLAPRFLSG